MAGIPEIRIQFSPLLYQTVATRLFREDTPRESLMSTSSARQKAMQYLAAWRLHEEEIVLGMYELFNLKFYKPVIDVYVSPWIPTISAPLIVAMRADPDEFVDVLSHELLHVLITDNTTYSQDSLGAVLNSLYPALDRVAKNHVLVHAGLMHIYLDVLREPRRLDRDIAHCQHEPAYVAAWDYVKAHNYLDVIATFKAKYSEMADQK